MLQKLIDDELLKKQKEYDTRQKSGKFKPSALGRCYRYQILLQRNEPLSNPPDARLLRIFKVGNIFHDFVQGLLPPSSNEVKVESEDLFGYADVVTEDTVYDIKSQHSGAFWHLEKSNKKIEEERFANILQLSAYAWLLKKPKMCLVLISRNDLCIAEYFFKYEDWKDKLQHELDMLRMYQEEGKLPPAEPRAFKDKSGKSTECKRCWYRDLCKSLRR
jgi:CRISPR/Cas system-associated exonuclease Cas4 (RecB family)